MSKSSALKNTADFYEEGRLLARYMTIFEQPELVMQLRTLSDLFNIHSQDDDVQDFDTRLDQAPSTSRETPLENVLEGLYKIKKRGSVKLQAVLTMYDPEIDAQLSESEDNGKKTH